MEISAESQIVAEPPPPLRQMLAENRTKSEHCAGPSTSENGKIWQNRVFHHFGCIGFFVVGHAEVVCIIVAVPACVQFCLECAHAYAEGTGKRTW